MKEELIVTTHIKLDLVDSLKCLFGRAIKVVTKVSLPYEEEVKSYNAHSVTTIEPTSLNFVKQDRPRFGYMVKQNQHEKINN